MILCCGEALIDMLPRTTTEGGSSYAPHAGGAVFNTAIALGRLGTSSGFLCGLSQDFFGDLLADTLAESHVDVSLSPRLDRPCTLAFVRLVDGQATYAFYDENTALKALTADALPAIPDHVEAMFFGGISLAGEPCGSAYEALLLREAPGRVTMVDPNVRPGFVRDRAAYVARVMRMMAASDVVKLSDEDLTWLMGPGAIEAHVATLRDAGTSLVLITEGAEGVTAYSDHGATRVPAERVEVVDTVGAGDTFNAGFLSGLSDMGLLTKPALREITQDQIRSAVSKGARTAAITVSRAGANPPWAGELT